MTMGVSMAQGNVYDQTEYGQKQAEDFFLGCGHSIGPLGNQVRVYA